MLNVTGLFGIHEKALLLRGERVGVLAANIANADTPNYKARDIDFAAALQQQMDGPVALTTTRSMHIAFGQDTLGSGAELKYRYPYQPSLDGNTVEAPIEQQNFAENAVRYQASLMFINRRVSGLELAMSG
jgi:flagellar basal-body rod protein FlgB